jgi:endonuclease/exonuclease/phosphatase family protein
VNQPHASSRLPAILLALVAALCLAAFPNLAMAGNHGHHSKSHGHHSKSHGHHSKSHGHHSKSHGHHSKSHGHHSKSHGHRGHKGHKGHGHGRGKEVRVMTRNLYLGANLTPAIGAPSLEAFVAANGQILREVTANNFPTRAKGLAAEILAKRPDLVGLQEVALWRTGPVNFEVLTKGPSATTVRYDYLQELLADLNQNGPRYEVVISQDEFDLEAPGDEDGNPATGPLGADINGRLTMRDVILARVGGGVQTWNAQSANFDFLLEVPILGQPLPIARGWTATDAKVRGSHPFRFVNTHLEAFQPEVRAVQAGELVAPGGPATGKLPVVLLGDLNSDDDTVTGADTLAYGVLLKAGFVERSTNNPLSCCLNSSLLAVDKGGGVTDFDHQVDHIMTNAPKAIGLRSSSVTGLEPVNGFWNSDHAGITSALEFGH